ncbi:uncharacterized protein LAESUDRAFT_810883 [Laetiporus sulphureus 93-53]|uniref:Uncharacterized protein n=1 Tax=Laetiporus sulphureus 93-53 TaxID=1314785 RepID=A0A165FP71_9APHY|nr:uncharacterized protein LAESUDRAFT_810883 [Laetiporus sulphureus 93-53]KZT09266.1 hypothetical protein LAESUDRAFT_810883 [Laetiporus sulphureus 93-53]
MLILVQNTAICALVAVFSALRMYAISGRKLTLTLLVLLLGSAPLVINLYTNASLSYACVVSLNGPPVCSWRRSFSQNLHQRLFILAGACSVVSDLIVLVTTWLRTFNVVREVGRFRTSASLGRLLLRDGSAYFRVMTILGIMEVTIETLNTNAQTDWPYLGFLRLSLSSILISRFILGLRQIKSNARNNSSQIAPDVYGTNSHGTRFIEETSADLHSDSFGGFSTVIVFDDWGDQDDVLGNDEIEEDAGPSS